MRLARDRVQGVDWLGDLVAGVAPSDIYRTIGRGGALVLAQTVTDSDLPVEIRRGKNGAITQWNVGWREIERRFGDACGPIRWEGLAPVMGVGHVQIDGRVGVLGVVGNVHVVRVLVDG